MRVALLQSAASWQGHFFSDARADAPLHREAFSSSLVRMHIGLSALQLRFLVTSCLAGVCVTALAVGWRVLVRPSNILTNIATFFLLLLLLLQVAS